jgi:hypothetical protein
VDVPSSQTSFKEKLARPLPS